MSDAHVDLYRSENYQPNCKWVPGWWDPICRVCQKLKRKEAEQNVEDRTSRM